MKLLTSEYLGSLEWLIDEGIMSVDTASAKPSSDIDGVIADLEALEKGLDKLEDKIYEFETVIMVDKSCRDFKWLVSWFCSTFCFYILH